MVAYVLGALHSEHCAAVHSNITICLPSFANPWTMLQVSLQTPVTANIAHSAWGTAAPCVRQCGTHDDRLCSKTSIQPCCCPNLHT